MENTVTLSIRIPGFIHRQLRVNAAANFRNLSQEIAFRLARSLQETAEGAEQSPDLVTGDSGAPNESAPRTPEPAA